MTIDSVREYCLSLPHATESIQWGNDLVMKVGGKIFAVIVLEPAGVWISFKCTPEDFAEWEALGATGWGSPSKRATPSLNPNSNTISADPMNWCSKSCRRRFARL